MRVPFWIVSRLKLKQRPWAFELLFKGTGLGSPQLNELFTKPSSAQSKNPTIHTYQQEYICIEQQEIVKEQCNKKRNKYIVKDS